MFYKIEPRKNPLTKEVKYHAIAKSIGMITSRQIAEELAATLPDAKADAATVLLKKLTDDVGDVVIVSL